MLGEFFSVFLENLTKISNGYIKGLKIIRLYGYIFWDTLQAIIVGNTETAFLTFFIILLN